MKLSYERPMMRAELFQSNAYCAGCNWKLINSTEFSLLKAVISGFTFYFDPKSQQNSVNDYTGDGQHFFTEWTGVLPEGSSNNEVVEAKNSWGNGLGTSNATSTYYLEWSAPREQFYVYQDMTNSGYSDSRNGSFTGGTGSLQVNGSGGQNGVSAYYDGGYYRSDRSIYQGRSATVTTDNQTELEFGFSY